MIIWSRWGFLTFICIGLGVGMALGIVPALTGETPTGLTPAVIIFGVAGLLNLLLVQFVYARLDKPRPVTYTVALPQPIVHPNGVKQTSEVRTALDEEGNPLWRRPSSSLFFIPVRAWTWIFLIGAVVLLVISLVSR